MKKRQNIFINTIKENYTFLLLLIGLVVVISIQGCQPSSPTFSIGNCCKIKNPALVTQACIATSLNNAECAAIAAQTGSSYELVPASSCLNFARNPDCGADEFNNKIGCYINDGSGVNKLIPQANPPEEPQPESKYCEYTSTKLNYCNQGEGVLIQDCAPQNCVDGLCQSCTSLCASGQITSPCNTMCCGPNNIVTMHFDSTYNDGFSTIDNTKWNIETNNGDNGRFTIVSQDGDLKMSKLPSTPDGFYSGNINSNDKFSLTGDFKIIINFEGINFPPAEPSRANQLQLEVWYGGNVWLVSRQNGKILGDASGYNTWYDVDGNSGNFGMYGEQPLESGHVFSSGMLQLNRTNGRIYASFYDISEDKWITIGLKTLGTYANVPVTVVIALQNNNHRDAISAYITDFIVLKGDRAVDSSGNNNHGWIYEAQLTEGKFINNPGLRFDGTDDYVNLNDINAIDGAPALSVESWIKWNGLVDGLTPAKEISRKNDVYAFGAGWGRNKAKFWVWDTSVNGWRNSGDSITNVGDGNWHHVVGVYDGTAGTVKIYVDGNLENTGSVGSTALNSNSNSVYLGAYKEANNEYWNGVIDEFKIYKRALTAQEILNRYNSNILCTDYS